MAVRDAALAWLVSAAERIIKLAGQGRALVPVGYNHAADIRQLQAETQYYTAQTEAIRAKQQHRNSALTKPGFSRGALARC